MTWEIISQTNHFTKKECHYQAIICTKKNREDFIKYSLLISQNFTSSEGKVKVDNPIIAKAEISSSNNAFMRNKSIIKIEEFLSNITDERFIEGLNQLFKEDHPAFSKEIIEHIIKNFNSESSNKFCLKRVLSFIEVKELMKAFKVALFWQKEGEDIGLLFLNNWLFDGKMKYNDNYNIGEENQNIYQFLFKTYNSIPIENSFYHQAREILKQKFPKENFINYLVMNIEHNNLAKVIEKVNIIYFQINYNRNFDLLSNQNLTMLNLKSQENVKRNHLKKVIKSLYDDELYYEIEQIDIFIKELDSKSKTSTYIFTPSPRKTLSPKLIETIEKKVENINFSDFNLVKENNRSYLPNKPKRTLPTIYEI